MQMGMAYTRFGVRCTQLGREPNAQPGQVDCAVETLNDMEHIETDVGTREDLPGKGNKAAMHITAKVFDGFALFQGIIGREVLFQKVDGALLKHINNPAVAAIFINHAVMDISQIADGSKVLGLLFPAFLLCIPLTDVTGEFVHTESFRQRPGMVENNVRNDL